jgi:hypothetical protein
MNENKSGNANKTITESKANKAAFISAFIFPGAGLWWLKHYVRACIFIVPTCLSLWYLVTKLYDSVAPVYSKLQREAAEGLINITDMGAIYGKLSTEIHRSLAEQQLGAVEAILVACWACSIVSSYFVGKKMDVANNTSIK